MSYEKDVENLKLWVMHSDRVIDNQRLLQLRTDCENNNHRGIYDELIKQIEKKLKA